MFRLKAKTLRGPNCKDSNRFQLIWTSFAKLSKFTAHCTMYTVQYTEHCIIYHSHSTLNTSQCILHTAHCTEFCTKPFNAHCNAYCTAHCNTNCIEHCNEINRSNHQGIHKQTKACWSIPRSQTVTTISRINF